MKYYLLTICLFFSYTTLFAESDEYIDLLNRAIIQLNNSEYLESQQTFQKIIDNDETAIFAQLGKLQADRFEMIEKYGNAFDKTELINQSKNLVKFYQKKLDEEPNNADLNFCTAIAIGFKLRAVLGEKNSFYIIYNGLQALKYIRKCDALEPGNPDVEFCKGMFEYYISQYPGIVKSFSKMLLSNTGDREVGRQRIHKAALSDGFLRNDGNYALAFLYLYVENKPGKAIPYTDYLVTHFPKNSGYHFLATFAFLQLGDMEAATSQFLDYEKSMEREDLFFREEYEKRSHFLKGFFALNNSDQTQAKYQFKQFVEDYDLELEHLLAIANLELGKIEDMAGNRKEAIKYYDAVIQINNRTYPIIMAKNLKESHK